MSVDKTLGVSSPFLTSYHFVESYPPLRDSSNNNLTGHSIVADGFIICDWADKLIKVVATYYGNTSILVAEVRALTDEVSSAIQTEFNKIVIEGDNQILIQALKGNIHAPWQISNIIADVSA